MAGAGYKLFNTGDVLTAAQVNTYLMEQTVMVFANAAARTTALSGVVSEGMISYLKDTNAVEVYDGSNWVSSDDPNAIQNTIVDAKGDLITATAADTPARLAVGNNGETLVADSSASTGLRWQGNFAAGKNKIINGDFNINQRAFSSTTTTGTYTFDRWLTRSQGDGTSTWSAQTFSLGTAPVAGYESTNYLRIVTTGQTAANAATAIWQRIESVKTLANQTATVSFWAKANSGTPKIGVGLVQNFGSGGSPSSQVYTFGTSPTISTSWARYSVTISVPSISGKTLGSTAGTDYLNLSLAVSAASGEAAFFGDVGIQTNTFEIWGVQVEAGNVATAFQTATGTLAGELCAAQRYYYRSVGGSTYSQYGSGQASSTTNAYLQIQHPVTMRVAPTSVDYSTLGLSVVGVSTTAITALSLTTDGNGAQVSGLTATVASGLTSPNRYVLTSNNSTTAYIGFSAEL